MAELKRNFGQAKMNKDRDERLVEPGQYRDANNVQIATSDESDAGSVQTVLGNTEVTTNVVLNDYSTCVGVHELPEKDFIYYFVHSGGHPKLQSFQPLIYKDCIVQYDTINQTSTYVFVDIYKVKQTLNQALNSNKVRVPSGSSNVYNYTGIRRGMVMTGTFTNNTGGNITAPNGNTVTNGNDYFISENDNVTVEDVIRDGSNGWHIVLSEGVASSVGDNVTFSAKRVLEFDPFIKITAIDDIDGLLLWTDGNNEPKKINIQRSIQGTGGNARVRDWDNTQARSAATNLASGNPNRRLVFSGDNSNFHTRISLKNELAMSRTDNEPVFSELSDITVIKPSPKFPLRLEMSETVLKRIPVLSSGNLGDANATSGFLSAQTKFRDSSGDVFEPGHIVSNINFVSPIDLRVGDIVILTDDITSDIDDLDGSDALVRATVSDAPGGMPNNGGSTGPYELTINSVSEDVQNVDTDFALRLESDANLFEFKFPRFSYRYKYVDGEYSAYAPWTQVAFIPGDFDYVCKKGFNIGMTNRVKFITLKDYFHEFSLVPAEVVAIDLLYKEESSPAIYTVKTLTSKNDNPEWPDRTNNRNRGAYTITSEMIHALVESNQLLRPYDNVPKSAKALAITGNRLVFGNYKQNYSLSGDIDLGVSFYHGFGENYKQPSANGLPSIKTLRTYQLGVVFGDKCGRETPVLVPKKSSSITLDKKWSVNLNQIRTRLDYTGTTVPSWAKYLKYYIKETSNEYYNLAMDRWYDAEDGNVWISFPSAERNKVDIDTYLILKKQHDSDIPVLERARYKIIAIENDAPDYIKTKKVSHGSIVMDSQVASVNKNAVNFIFSKANFEAGFGDRDKFLADTWSKISSGFGYARIVGSSGGNTATTDWVQVVSIKGLASNNGNDTSIRIATKFGDEADMSSILSGTINYSLELREDVVTNRPEFNGRFFVKIYKDLLLKDAVMVDQDPSIALSIQDSFDIRLLVGPRNRNNQNFQKHPTRTATSTAGHTHPFNRSGNVTYSGQSGQSTKFNANFFSGGGFASFTAGGGHEFGHCGNNNSNSRTKDWWESFSGDRLYIEGIKVNGYNWKSSGHPHHNNRNGVHFTHSGDPATPGSGYGTQGGDDCGGIRHYSSYSRIYFGFMGWFADHSAAQSRIHKFYELMKTSGTIFRFRDDPTQTAYKVIDRGGAAEVYNFARTSGCKNCKPHKTGCKSSFFNVMFEKLDGGGPMDPKEFDVLSLMRHDGGSTTAIDILREDYVSESGGSELSTENPAIWETEPKEDIGLDIYYEATGCLPLDVDADNNELLIPLGSTFKVRNPSGNFHLAADGITDVIYEVTAVNQDGNKDITNLTVRNTIDNTMGLTDAINHNQIVAIDRYDGSCISLYIVKDSGNYAAGATAVGILTGKSPTDPQGGPVPWRAPHFNPLKLGWSNCFAFGNGIESDRVRDGFALTQIANGVKASSVAAQEYAEEHRASGFIWSGIFNSISGTNNLNQFIQAEPITKDLNPSHGSIQKIVARNTNTLAFCEDKILSILTNKDALFNADGGANVSASNKVLGNATPIPGDYGISTNPESVSVTSDAIYWCDQMRSQVLKLQGGSSISVISEAGMKDYFNDNLKDINFAIGSYDDKKSEYNLTLAQMNGRYQYRPTTTTISWSDRAQGWTSFKDFNGLEFGVSLNNEYYTFRQGSMWKHHTNNTVNNFYGVQYFSDITMIFNEMPSSVKSFNLINYEGTQARITEFSTVTQGGVNYTDGEYYNLNAKAGWYLDNLKTDLQDAENIEFKEKEGKWFASLKGVTSTDANLDQREFSVQGLGVASISSSGSTGRIFKITVKVNSTASDGTNWDSSGADPSTFRFLGPSSTPTMTEQQPTGNGIVTDTISNMVLNSQQVAQYSGFDLDAADFEVPGGTLTTSGSGNSTIYIYTKASGWNADPEVSQVEFFNQGIAGDPGNRVSVRISYNSFTMPSSDKTIFVDVDLKSSASTPPIVANTPNRTSVFRVSFTPQNNSSVSVGGSSISHVSANGYSSMSNTNKHSGVVAGNQSTIVATYTVTSTNDSHLSPLQGSDKGVNVFWNPLTANLGYENQYAFNVINTMHTATGQTNRIKSSTIEISYTPPVGISGLDPDPSDFDALLHDIRFTYEVKALPTVSNRITNVLTSPNAILSSSKGILVRSNATGNFGLQVAKLNAAGNAVDSTYNFSNQTFEALEGSGNVLTSTFATSDQTSVVGVFQKDFTVAIPSNGAGTYSIICSAGSLALDSSVPNAINELNFTVLEETGNQTFTPTTKTNLNASGSTTIHSATELTQLGETSGERAFTFTYTKSSGTMTLDRQPTVRDFKGSLTKAKPISDENSNVNTIHIADTAGIKVGMVASHEAIPVGTTVITVTTNDSVTLSANTTAAIPQEETIEFTSDYDYTLKSAVATINEAATVVTVTGVIKVNSYGRKSTASIPDGNVILQPNFITIT